MKYKDNNKGEVYNSIKRKAYPAWAGWRVIDEQKRKPNFPDNLKEREELLDDLEYSFIKMGYENKQQYT